MMPKPPYSVPSMADIAAIPWNGLRVVSTFSGCGGSCLGYRMAGYRVVWANEFVPVAHASYRANMADECLLDGRDIHQIRPEEILAATGLQIGDLDILDGSPPCQAFSTAGKRAKGWGQAQRYEHGAQQCNETLFTEYIRLLRGLQPRAFVAENVSGLVKGVAKGYFKEILRDLKASGYRVEARLLDAQWLGVPQMRQRIIFQGVREDLGRAPVWPRPLPYRYSVREVLGIAFRPKSYAANPWIESDCPAAAIQASGQYFVEGANGFNGHAGSPMDGPMPTVQAGRPVHVMHRAVHDYQLIAPSRRRRDAYNYADVLPDAPCPTVTIGSPGNDLGVPVGEPPIERRKFTIAELKRICAFPDDFVLVGSYAQQWERLGNAVPPVMMFHIAKTLQAQVFDGLAVHQEL